MKGYQYLDENGVFQMQDPELYSYLYFPMANEAGMMSSITPDLGGDAKGNQNTFLLEPVSSENLHNNKSTRNIWCRINGKELWSVSGRSAAQQAALFGADKEESSLEAGFMWQKMTRVSQKYGIRAEVTSFVPCEGGQNECMQVVLKNVGSQDMELEIMTAIPLYARSADNIRDHRHVTSLLHRISATEYGILVEPTLTFDERGHKKNEMAYGVFAGSGEEKPCGFIPAAQDLIGEGGSFEHPRALYETEWPLVKSGAKTDGYEAVGAAAFEKKTLHPGEERCIYVVMGMAQGKEALLAEVMPLLKKEAQESALEKTKRYWQDKVNVRYASGDHRFDGWMRWVSFQPILRRLYGCSFLPHHDYGKGGRGWRDLWQDCLALLLLDPADVRQMLIDNFGGVRADGSNATIIGTKQGEFIADRNHITRVWMDHGMWPLLTTDLYIQQTGDIRILLEKQAYFKDAQICRGEEKDGDWEDGQGNQVRCADGSIYQGTLLEHLLLQNITECYDVGEHGHIRLRGADWNDALDLASRRGESVAFTNMYADNLERLAGLLEELKRQGVETVEIAEEMMPLFFTKAERFADIAEKQEVLRTYYQNSRHVLTGQKQELAVSELAEALRSKGAWMKQHIRETEWIEDETGCGWFNGYYDDHGNAVEGKKDGQVRMMLTSQVFSVMAKTADETELAKIIRAADQYLYREEVGGYRLNTDFNEVKMDLGRMFGFAYGQKENGAVFSHMAVMYANALYTRGASAAGFKAIHTLFEHCSDFEKSHIYPGVPEYVDARGRGLYHYLTGAASWLLLTVVTQMYGVRGSLGDLTFVPQLLKEQFDEKGEASLTCLFADRKLTVTYRNPKGLEAGEYRVTKVCLNGKEYQEGRIARAEIEALAQQKTHSVTVELG